MDTIMELLQRKTNRQFAITIKHTPQTAKKQANIDLIELTGQSANGSATGPQDIFIEH